MHDMDFHKNENIEGIRLLNQSIASFNGAALKFERYYRHLEQRVEELDLELKAKNEELKKNLEEKEEIKNYLRNILESLTTGVLVIDLKGMVTTYNRAAEDITGLSSQEVKGKGFEEVFKQKLFPKFLLDPDPSMDVRQSMKIETEILRNEKDVIHVSLSTFPVWNYQREKVGTALTIQDITHLKKLEEKANRTDRLAAMGEMAAEIAHEIRNPLGSIELFATTLKKDLEGFGDLQTLAEHISSGVKSMNNIISNLLLFIRPQQRPEFQVIDICSLFNESLIFSEDLVESNEGVDIVANYSSEPLPILGDPGLLKQACLNIIMNAVQAMSDGGRLTISTSKLNGKTKGSSFVEIRFSDTGKGVSSEDMPKIFDPFFTTRKGGTGLGLAIVHNIVKIHDGEISMYSSKEEGTVFTVTLPLWEPANGT